MAEWGELAKIEVTLVHKIYKLGFNIIQFYNISTEMIRQIFF